MTHNEAHDILVKQPKEVIRAALLLAMEAKSTRQYWEYLFELHNRRCFTHLIAYADMERWAKTGDTGVTQSLPLDISGDHGGTAVIKYGDVETKVSYPPKDSESA